MNASATDSHDWFLRDWMRVKGLRQADMAEALDWPKGRVSKVVNGAQPYRRELVAEIARWLEIEPFELLMRPEEAKAFRDLRESAMAIAADSRRADWIPAPPPKARASGRR